LFLDEEGQLQVTYPLVERPQMVICLRRATELVLGARRGYIRQLAKLNLVPEFGVREVTGGDEIG
jgi:hypothetical protein